MLLLFINTSTASTSDPISSWDWNFGDGTPHATIQSPSHVYATSGTYTVTQIITTQAGCKDSVKLPITVNPLPQAAFTSNTICAGTVSSLTDNSILPAGETITWSWNLSGGTPATSTAQNPSVSFPTGGTYTVSEIVTTQFGCSDTTVLPVIVNAIPQAAFSSNTVCAGNVTSLTDNSTSPSTGGAITSWSWNFPSGNPSTSTTQNPIVTFPAGIYNVTLVITAQNSCTNTTILPVAIYGLPIANFSSNSPCIGNATNFVDLSVSPSGDNITSWSWNMAGGTPAASAITNPFTIYNTPGTYTATLTVTTQGGCKDTISHPVTVFAPPVANFSGSGVGCAPICVTNYKDSSTTLVGNNIVSWQWSFPGGSPASYITNNSPGNPSSICYNSPGAFGASLIVTTANGCKDSISINPVANVYPLPKSSFCILSNPVPVTDPVFSFCDQWSNDVVQWVWTFGDGDSASNIVNPVHSYSATATNNDFYTYNVCLNVKNQFGCWDSVCHVVELLPEFTFYISNSFTPNGDGNNDFFFGKGRGIKDYNIWVFDRWGNDIWDCHYSGKNTDWDNTNQDGMPSACKWDGVVVKGGMDMSGGSGKVVQEDVYVWKVKLTDVFDKAHTYIGRVSVVK